MVAHITLHFLSLFFYCCISGECWVLVLPLMCSGLRRRKVSNICVCTLRWALSQLCVLCATPLHQMMSLSHDHSCPHLQKSVCLYSAQVLHQSGNQHLGYTYCAWELHISIFDEVIFTTGLSSVAREKMKDPKWYTECAGQTRDTNITYRESMCYPVWCSLT